MKHFLLIIIIYPFLTIYGQTNDLKLDSIFHRSNVGEFYPSGLDYFQISQSQMRVIECSALVSNIGENDMTNCYLAVDLVYDDLTVFTYYSDSVFIPSDNQDSLYLNVHFDLVAHPIGEYIFNYTIFSDSLEIDYINNEDSINFEITENTLSRSDFIISDSTNNYYPDSLGIESFGYVFKMENDACLSAVYPWVTYDLSNAMGSSRTNASLFILDSINNKYDPIGVTDDFIPELSDLGNRYKIDCSILHSELIGGNTYLITVNTPTQFSSFYLCQKAIDSTAYTAYTDGFPGGSYIYNEPLYNARMIKMDIEFETAWFCSLSNTENAKDYLKIYPNPSTGIIVIEYDFDKDLQYIIQLVDLKGKLIVEYSNVNNTDGTFVINKENLSDGIYIVRVLSDDFSVTERVIIQR